jgi:hypothetical protein
MDANKEGTDEPQMDADLRRYEERSLVEPRSGEIFVVRQLPGSCRMSLRALGIRSKMTVSAEGALEAEHDTRLY